MAVSLNADVGQIVKNFLSKKGGKSKGNATPSLGKLYYKQAAIKCVLALCIIGIISWSITYLSQSSVVKDESEFVTIQDLQDAVVKIEQDITSSKALLAKNQKKVEETLPMFSDNEGSKSLFKLISNIAASNNLTIRNLSQGETTEMNSPAKFYQNKILLDVEGFYPNYVNFKKELSIQKPILRIESETLKLKLSKEGERRIEVSLNFIDYAVNKNEYEIKPKK